MTSRAGVHVTLCVPTMNRSEFVARLLRYYASQGFAGRVAIGDSSGPEHLERTRQAIRDVTPGLDVLHVEAAGLGVGPCLKRLCELAGTPYVAVVPDDDFLVPGALERCAQFLADHPDYVAAHGAGVTLTLDSNSLHGNVASCGPYAQPVLEAEMPAQRLRDLLAGYLVSLFSVFRTDSWRTMLQDVGTVSDAAFANEILPCCVSAVLGKIKELDGLYLVRQSHDRRVQLPTMFDWIATPVWFPSYTIAEETLAQALVQRQSLALDDARAVVKAGFRDYVGTGLGRRRDWGRDAWMLDVARRAWRVVQAVRPKPERRWSLDALLSPASADHAAFMPIYEALVSPSGDTGRRAPASGAIGSQ
jgi:glycosyltransferase domain-containing protein